MEKRTVSFCCSMESILDPWRDQCRTCLRADGSNCCARQQLLPLFVKVFSFFFSLRLVYRRSQHLPTARSLRFPCYDPLSDRIAASWPIPSKGGSLLTSLEHQTPTFFSRGSRFGVVCNRNARFELYLGSLRRNGSQSHTEKRVWALSYTPLLVSRRMKAGTEELVDPFVTS